MNQQQFDLIGKTLAEAATILNEASVSYRVTRRDNDRYLCSADHRQDRINLQLDDGKVSAYSYG